MALALSLSACGDTTTESDDPTVATGGPSTAGAPVQGPRAGCPDSPPLSTAPAGSTTDLTKKPAVPGGPKSVAALQVADVVVGTGATACKDSAIEVRYVGVLADGGEQFDASWDRGPDEVFPLTLGAGDVIRGWDQGLVGMRAGGRRQLTIPAELAYGPEGRPGIPGGATLVFVVDLVEIAGP